MTGSLPSAAVRYRQEALMSSARAESGRGAVGVEDIDEFLENAAVSLHFVGPDGTILRANRFELDFLGYHREEYEGRHVAEFHADQDVIADILARLTRGETLDNYPARLIAKDGSIRHVLISSNVRWVDGRFVHTRCFTRDITDRVLMEQELARMNIELEEEVAQRTAELRQANQQLQDLVELKDRFVAMVSHELRTPLTSIHGFSVTMERLWDALPDDQKRGFVAIIGRQSERLTRLVNDLLTLSRLSSGTLRLSEQRVPVRDAVEQAVRDLAADGVEIDVPAELAVLADSDGLQQILVNYLANAIKYAGPPIRVSGAAATGGVEIRVADEGAGIPAGFVAFLFDEYSRRPQTDTAVPQPGSGLGLAIVRQLAEAHRGTAWYEPNTPHGSVFAVRLSPA
jgi:PAS domain S-box-containing protein